MRTTERNSQPEESNSAVPHSMVARVAEILDQFTLDERVLTVSELSRRTGLAKSTVSRITRELIEYDWLERVGNGLAIGIRVFELGQRADRPRDLKRVSAARLAQLRRTTGHTVHLAVLEELEVVYLDILHSRTTPRLPSRIGGRMPAHATAVGKVLLAFGDPVRVNDAIRRGLVGVGPRTITEGDALKAELQEIRSTGLAIERQESSRHSCCVAVAITDASRHPIAAISVSGWDGELDVGQVSAAILAAGQQLSADLLTLPRGAERDAVKLYHSAEHQLAARDRPF